MENASIIYFDGICNLCHTSVQYVMKHDYKRYFYFASLQGQHAQKHLPKSIFKGALNTVYVRSNQGEILAKSKAVLCVLAHLKYRHRILGRVLNVLPLRVLDACYDLVAQSRYKLFGKKASCSIPENKESESRILT